MSGIAGILRHDGRPADRPVLDRMAGVLASRGPDGVEVFAEGPVGLVHGMLHATPESEREIALPADPATGLRLAWDGRLDNRDEVGAAAAAAGAPPRGDSDADLVLAALAAFGDDAPARLLGDFALAAWDGRRRRLLCARDAVGVRPLFYAARPDAFVFGSAMAVLLEDPAVAPRPDEGWVAEWLAQAVTSPAATIFEGILRLPPGHLLIVEEGRVCLRPFWEPRFDPAVAALDEGACEERLRELLHAAVGARLRSRTVVGVDCSGGLDSSAVAAIAADLRRRGAAGAPGLLAQSMIYPGLPCDETPFLRDAVRATELPAAEYVGAPPSPGEFADHVRRHGHLPDNPASTTFRPLGEDTRRRGIRVRLGGEGGDERFGPDSGHLADLLRAGRLARGLRSLRRDAGGAGARAALAVLWSEGVRPLVPLEARRLLRRVRGHPPAPPWIPESFARRVALADRVREEPARGAWPTFVQAGMWNAARSGTAAMALEDWDRQAADQGCEARQPFLDRRILEFALSLPRERRVRDGVEKVVLRGAVRELLPDSVRSRPVKSEFSVLFARALAAVGGAARFERLAVAEAGWVDGEWVRAAALRVLPAGGAPDSANRRVVHVLWSVFALDLWYRWACARGDAT